MSIQNVVAFGNAVYSDEALQAELKSATGDATGQERYAKAAEFASSKGYDVTAAELQQGYEATQKSDVSELNDAELEMVSGGKSGSQAGKNVANWDRNATAKMEGAFNEVGNFFKSWWNG